MKSLSNVSNKLGKTAFKDHFYKTNACQDHQIFYEAYRRPTEAISDCFLLSENIDGKNVISLFLNRFCNLISICLEIRDFIRYKTGIVLMQISKATVRQINFFL